MSQKLNLFYEKMKSKNGDWYSFDKMPTCLLGKNIKVWHEDKKFYLVINKNNICLEFTTISGIVDFIENNIPDDFTTRMNLFPLMRI